MTTYAAFIDQGWTDDEGLSKAYNDNLFSGGVAKGLRVSQRGAGANLSVDIAVGYANVMRTGDLVAYPSWTDAIVNAVVAAASPSNPRKDVVVAYIDVSAFVNSSSSPNNPGAFKFMVVAGTPSGSPVLPNDAAIQAAVGALNPFIKLANVDVGTNATTVVDANITDIRVGSALRVFDFINDRNGNKLLESGNAANAVNWLKVNNSANGTAPSIEAKGSDANIDVNLVTKGTGQLKVNGQALASTDGFLPLNTTVTGVTALGNGQYDIAVNSDVRSVIDPGAKIRGTRSNPSLVTSALLNGTSHYFNRSGTITGMTQTDDIAAGAWIKLDNYPASGAATIQSRFNGTSGWIQLVNADGLLILSGYNGSVGNASGVNSYISVPLKRWVHVVAQNDMSAFTVSSTTSYVMFNGVNVPAVVARSGTNPTSFVQAGNYEIGSYNGGSNFFPGRIAQVFVTSQKLAQTAPKTIAAQQISASDVTTYNMVSAYSLSVSSGLTDINTTNANNLTAQNGALTTNNDAPWGGQANGTISSVYDYGIVQKVTASVITVHAPEGCTFPTTGLSAIGYSYDGKPYGFPSDPAKWWIEALVKVAHFAPTTGGVYINPNSIQVLVPTGSWNLGFTAAMIQDNTGSGIFSPYGGLSTSPTSASDNNLIVDNISRATIASSSIFPVGISDSVTVSTPTPYYLIATFQIGGGTVSVGYVGTRQTTIIRAKNAYL